MLFSRLLREEKGFTLTEYVIGLALLGMVLQGGYMFSLYGERSYDQTAEAVADRAESAAALKHITKDLREATTISEVDPRLAVADKNELTLYADIDNDLEPERIHYDMSNQSLTKEITEPDNTGPPWTYPNNATSNVIVNQRLKNSGNEPIFRYYYEPTNELTNVPLNAADRTEVRIIEVHLLLDKKDNIAPEPFSMSAEVFMRNVE